MNRRHFLQTGLTAGILGATACATNRRTIGESRLQVVDCHTHFYDPSRPEGVPWPSKSDEFLYRTILPASYRSERTPQPVAGTVVVEASPWVEDNQWILDLARDEPFIVGFCGNLDPRQESFATDLARFSANPLFSGIRVSGGRFDEVMRDPVMVGRLDLLATRNLQLDVNVGTEALPNVAKLAAAVPSLRIVIDHLANTGIDGRIPDPSWVRGMVEVARRPNVFAKVSGLVEGAGRSQEGILLTFIEPMDFIYKQD
jgi:L-fuconolactonase